MKIIFCWKEKNGRKISNDTTSRCPFSFFCDGLSPLHATCGRVLQVLWRLLYYSNLYIFSCRREPGQLWNYPGSSVSWHAISRQVWPWCKFFNSTFSSHRMFGRERPFRKPPWYEGMRMKLCVHTECKTQLCEQGLALSTEKTGLKMLCHLHSKSIPIKLQSTHCGASHAEKRRKERDFAVDPIFVIMFWRHCPVSIHEKGHDPGPKGSEPHMNQHEAFLLISKSRNAWPVEKQSFVCLK